MERLSDTGQPGNDVKEIGPDLLTILFLYFMACSEENS
jgi:hypothetical protein